MNRESFYVEKVAAACSMYAASIRSSYVLNWKRLFEVTVIIIITVIITLAIIIHVLSSVHVLLDL